jgi:hypothetical protein
VAADPPAILRAPPQVHSAGGDGATALMRALSVDEPARLLLAAPLAPAAGRPAAQGEVVEMRRLIRIVPPGAAAAGSPHLLAGDGGGGSMARPACTGGSAAGRPGRKASPASSAADGTAAGPPAGADGRMESRPRKRTRTAATAAGEEAAGGALVRSDTDGLSARRAPPPPPPPSPRQRSPAPPSPGPSEPPFEPAAAAAAAAAVGPAERAEGPEPGRAEWEVAASRLEQHTREGPPRRRRIRRRPAELPALALRRSAVPGGGWGVFARGAIRRGAWVTEYGGEAIGRAAAAARRGRGEDTHMRALGFKDLCLDSRVRGAWDLGYYTRWLRRPVGGRRAAHDGRRGLWLAARRGRRRRRLAARRGAARPARARARWKEEASLPLPSSPPPSLLSALP